MAFPGTSTTPAAMTSAAARSGGAENRPARDRRRKDRLMTRLHGFRFARPPARRLIVPNVRRRAPVRTYNIAGMTPLSPGALTPRNLEIRATFDAIAPRYDLTNRVLSCGVDVYWRRAAIRTFRDLP